MNEHEPTPRQEHLSNRELENANINSEVEIVLPPELTQSGSYLVSTPKIKGGKVEIEICEVEKIFGDVQTLRGEICLETIDDTNNPGYLTYTENLFSDIPIDDSDTPSVISLKWKDEEYARKAWQSVYKPKK
jgi:hypothetical protein